MGTPAGHSNIVESHWKFPPSDVRRILVIGEDVRWEKIWGVKIPNVGLMVLGIMEESGKLDYTEPVWSGLVGVSRGSGIVMGQLVRLDLPSIYYLIYYVTLLLDTWSIYGAQSKKLS